MNRRRFLQHATLGAIGGVAGFKVGESIIEQEPKPKLVTMPPDVEWPQDQYLKMEQPEPTFRIYTGNNGSYTELRHDGTDFVIENMATGRKLVV